MKRIAVICLAIIIILIPTLTINCSGGNSENLDIKNPEEKIKWIETQPLVCSYTADEVYCVTVGGELSLIGKDTVEIYSIITRLYNSSGEVVDEQVETSDPAFSFSKSFHWDSGLNHCYEQEVISYDMFVTDSEGTEYACVTD